jgi:hypothetical protein
LLDIPAGTVKTRMMRAKAHLRRRSEPSVLVHPGRAARASDAPKPPLNQPCRQ